MVFNYCIHFMSIKSPLADYDYNKIDRQPFLEPVLWVGNENANNETGQRLSFLLVTFYYISKVCIFVVLLLLLLNRNSYYQPNLR